MVISTAGSAERRQRFGDHRRVDQRLVALDVDDDVAVERRGHFGEAVGAAAVVGAGHHRHAAVGLDRVAHARVVGRDDDLGDPRRPPRLFDDADDHRQAAEVDQGLAGEPGRRVAGRG